MKPPYELDRLLGSKPIAVIFQEPACTDCDLLVEKSLRNPDAPDLLDRFHVVQLDRLSNEPVTTPSGEATTAADWTDSAGLSYFPSILFFDENGAEVMRIDSQLRTFHVLSTFDYVAQKRYLASEPFQRFLGDRADLLLEQGRDGESGGY